MNRNNCINELKVVIPLFMAIIHFSILACSCDNLSTRDTPSSASSLKIISRIFERYSLTLTDVH